MTRSLRPALLVLAALLLPLPALAQELTEEWGYDRKGDDYDSFRVGDVARCKSACRRDRRCQAYTFTHDAVCYLKSRINSKKQAFGAVTGYRQEPGAGADDDYEDDDRGNRYPAELTEERGFDRKGDDYTSFRARGVADCKRSCARENRCRAYTFDTRYDVCYLKSRINSQKYDARMVTGYKEDDSGTGGGDWSDGPESRGGLTEERGYDRRGADFRRFDASSVNRCKRACWEDASCLAYTFDRRDSRCYLKDEIRPAERNRDMVTGRKIESEDDEEEY